MGSLIKIILIDDATVLVLFKLFRIGFIHPENAPGKIIGILLGIWRFEIQTTLGIWNKDKQGEYADA
jgi:hypothetical protein